MTAKREILATAFKLRALAAGLEAAVNTPSKGHKRAVEDTRPLATWPVTEAWLRRRVAEITGKSPSEPTSALGAWRAAHRPGRPSRIASDPEVEAFVLDRIEVMTYAEIVAAVAARFPKARHISSSGLQRWWAKRRPAIS